MLSERANVSRTILASLCQVVLFIFPLSGNAQEILRLHTATAVHDSGLLDQLLPLYNDTGAARRIDVFPMSSGEAVESARRSEADLIITQAPELERALVLEGYSGDRHPFAVSRHIIVGPRSDPALVASAQRWEDAMRLIVAARDVAIFVSRGDNGGTHIKELALWHAINVDPSAELENYLEAGVGMAAALELADEHKGYLISEESSLLAHSHNIDLVSLFSDDSRKLKNIFSVLIVRPSRSLQVGQLAEHFQSWLTGPMAQSVISNYTQNDVRPFKAIHK